MTHLAFQMLQSLWHSFALAYGVINVPQFLNSALYILIKGETTHFSDCFPEGGMMKLMLVCELELLPLSLPRTWENRIYFITLGGRSLLMRESWHKNITVYFFSWERVNNERFLVFSSNGGVLDEQKSEHFSQGLIWHVPSHSIWNEINVQVLFQVFMWKKIYLIFSEEVSLHITPVYHSFTEWESGKDPWVLLLQRFYCLVIVINETKCPESVLQVLLLFVGALSCPDPAECAEAKSKKQNARITSSSSKAQRILPGGNGHFHRERHKDFKPSSVWGIFHNWNVWQCFRENLWQWHVSNDMWDYDSVHVSQTLAAR